MQCMTASLPVHFFKSKSKERERKEHILTKVLDLKVNMYFNITSNDNMQH